MSILRCFQNAAAMGVISQEEARILRTRYEGMLKDGVNESEARQRMVKQIQAEADHRERAGLLTNLAIDKLLLDLSKFRNWQGDPDEAEAFIQLHENFGHHGTFIQDAKGREEVIAREAIAELKDLLKEGKRGAVTGDLRRAWNPKVKARMDNIFREVHGVDTGDVKAKAIAKAWEATAEKLRLRFNAAGGAIGKLQGGYVPQSHDALALLDFGRKAWVDFMMEKGRLDRDRMVDSVSGLPLTDQDLREALGTTWDRITTNGYFDADVSAAPQGMGALYTQHMDHRFIHFKTPEMAMEYSRRFGNGGDVFAAMMGHVGVMARDIAHMEIFGPNPTRTRQYLKSAMIKRAANMKSNAVVIGEQVARMKDLAARLTAPNPEYAALSDRLGAILNEMDAIRRKYAPQLGGKPSARNKAKLAALQAEFLDVSQKLIPFEKGEMDKMVSDKAVEAEMNHVLEEMRAPDVDLTGAPRRGVAVSTDGVPSGVREGGREDARVRKKFMRADAMWEAMRGGQVGDPRLANVMQSVRNTISSAALGSAVISSLTDPAFGQDVRLRMGMALKESNFVRIAIANLREMITMGNRDDAIAAMLGIDSGLRVLHRSASEVRGIDHKFWTSYFADRVLTTGMLTPWTQAGKHVMGMDVMRFVARMTEHDWKDLPDRTRRTFETHGLTEKDWLQLKYIELHDGVILRPNEVIAHNRELGERYLQMILREVKYAIPEASVRSSSLVMSREPAGTIVGEMLRSATQFKGFAFGVMMLHHARIARDLRVGEASDRLHMAGYAAMLFITSTALGMMAIALKDIKDGRDPRKWLDEKTWLDPFYLTEGILQAGGLGIFGDFLRASENRLGGGLAGTIAGPVVGKAENIIGIVSPGQVGKYLRSKDVTSAEEAVRFLRSGTIPGSNHWAIAMIYQRKLMDTLQRMVDADAQRSFNRQINNRMRDYNQQYYWQPGSPSPSRGPDLTRPFATR